ncbi:MAG: hypothetical protein Q8P20_08750 [bacterium]|nr:hypothetical protein [bacterium]
MYNNKIIKNGGVKNTMIIKNKKGQGGGGLTQVALVVFIIAALGITIFAGSNLFGAQTPAQEIISSNLGNACSADTDCGSSLLSCVNSVCAAVDTSGVKSGKAATLTVAAFDKANDSDTQTSGPSAYVWLHNGGDKKLITNAGTLSATSRLSVTDISTGDVVDAIAFSSSTTSGWYGVPKTGFTVAKESQPLDLDVYAAVVSGDRIDVDVFDEDGNNVGAGIDGSQVNLTFSGTSGDVASFEKIKYTQNQSNLAFRASAFLIDVTETSNITKVTIGSSSPSGVGSQSSANTIERLRTSDYFIPIEPPIMMMENEELILTSISFESTGSVGNGNAAGEAITLRLVDSGYFIDKNRQLGFGYEDDTSSHGDVGTGDMSILVNASSAFA